MKEIIHNRDNLTKKDITEIVVRTKALIINNGNILLGNESKDHIYQFPGGHLEENETLEECLIREVKEETGMEITKKEIKEPVMKVTFRNKDWPEIGKNRQAEIYYYVIETNKEPDMTKVELTDEEIYHGYVLESISLDKVIDILKDNIKNNEKNHAITPDMIEAIEIYKQTL